MKLLYISGSLDHINYPLCKAFYDELGSDFIYVAKDATSPSRADLQYESLNDTCPFVVKLYEKPELAAKLINDADVVIYGSAPEATVRQRMLSGKLTFRNTERLYKEPFTLRNTIYRILSAYYHHGRYQRGNVHILAAGAYVAKDFSRYHFYQGRIYKWCYFTKVSEKSISELEVEKSKNQDCEIIWTARFIPLKCPELVVELASFLKEKGDNFHINMVGSGDEKYVHSIKKLSNDLGLEKHITFMGSLPPDSVRSLMEKANLSLFTSDRREGWGAVVNEAMGCACAVIASAAAGSSPFLIENEINGELFDINDKNEFFARVHSLINDKSRMIRYGEQAYKTIHMYWTPENAARSLIKLSESILGGKVRAEEKGPCSFAPIMNDGWFSKK